MKIKPVIMAGGSGTRMWPLSRELYPKQFIKIFDKFSLLQKTLLRNESLGKPLVIVYEEHKFIAAQQIKEIGIDADLITEPFPKNTAPPSIIASIIAINEGFKNVLLLPADHYISDEKEYLSGINMLSNHLEKSNIGTIGIKPTSPNTGYGYIQIKEPIYKKVYKVQKFVEKPNLDLAENYIKQGGYFWNSGIFLYNPHYMIKKVKDLQKGLFDKVSESLLFATKDSVFTRLDKDSYSTIEAISIDYAIMEHSSDIIMFEANFDWQDLGAWGSLWQISEKDSNKNCFYGDVIAQDVTNSYIMSNRKLASVIGLNNIIVIDTEDALLVADKSKSEEVKQIVNQLASLGKKETREHRQVFYPWGYYRIIDIDNLYIIRHIIVLSSQILSFQYNNQSAHWVIIQGIAEIIIDTKIIKLSEKSSIYIEKSLTHELTNIGDIDLKIIEIQMSHSI